MDEKTVGKTVWWGKLVQYSSNQRCSRRKFSTRLGFTRFRHIFSNFIYQKIIMCRRECVAQRSRKVSMEGNISKQLFIVPPRGEHTLTRTLDTSASKRDIFDVVLSPSSRFPKCQRFVSKGRGGGLQLLDKLTPLLVGIGASWPPSLRLVDGLWMTMGDSTLNFFLLPIYKNPPYLWTHPGQGLWTCFLLLLLIPVNLFALAFGRAYSSLSGLWEGVKEREKK